MRLPRRLSWVHRQRRIPIRRCAWRSTLTAPHRRSSSRRCATRSFRRRRLLSYAWSAWVRRRSRFAPTPTSYLCFRAGPSVFSPLCRRCSWRVPRSPWLPNRASRCRSFPPIPPRSDLSRLLMRVTCWRRLLVGSWTAPRRTSPLQLISRSCASLLRTASSPLARSRTWLPARSSSFLARIFR